MATVCEVGIKGQPRFIWVSVRLLAENFLFFKSSPRVTYSVASEVANSSPQD